MTSELCSCRAFEPHAFAQYRDCPLKEITAAFASSGGIEAAATLLQHHPYTLTPHILDILSSFPETLPPKTYLNLLPMVITPNFIMGSLSNIASMIRIMSNDKGHWYVCRVSWTVVQPLQLLQELQTGWRLWRCAVSCRSWASMACWWPQSTWQSCTLAGGLLQHSR